MAGQRAWWGLFLVMIGAGCHGQQSDRGGVSPWVRQPVVAGQFYPADPDKLRLTVETFLDAACDPGTLEAPVAIIAPHAGYLYSGQIAADAFSAVRDADPETVVVLGTNHRAPGFDGFAVWPRGGFRTPLGVAPIDETLSRTLLDADPECVVHDAAHLQEHSIEVQVPFVQTLFPNASLMAIVVATVDPEKCRRFGEALAATVQGRKVLIVASSDLSHYPAYADAQKSDGAVVDAICSMNPDTVHRTIKRLERSGISGLGTCACGQGPIMAVMTVARELGATHAIRVSQANSGDLIVGDRDRVVGYAAVAFAQGVDTPVKKNREASIDGLNQADKRALLALARQTIGQYLATDTLPLVRGFQPEAGVPRGAFVTLKKNGVLRGCIGHMAEDMPLCRCVSAMALQAAFADRRFPQVRLEEMPEIDIEISALTPMQRVSGPEAIVVGQDGVQIRKRGHSAVFLPQVAPEQGWTRDEMLDHLCLKAGLTAGCWRSNTEFYVFQAEVFGEDDANRPADR